MLLFVTERNSSGLLDCRFGPLLGSPSESCVPDRVPLAHSERTVRAVLVLVLRESVCFDFDYANRPFASGLFADAVVVAFRAKISFKQAYKRARMLWPNRVS